MSFGDRLRELRKSAGLTQRELADRAGIDFTYLSKVENDKEQASEETIRKLAEEVGADSDELLLLARKPPASVHEAMKTDGGRTFLRSAKGLNESEWRQLADQIERMRKKK